jgi:TrmH family RNA methyltransferase
MLAPLRDRGYLTCGPDGAAITREGEQAVAAMWAVQERVEDELYAGFTQADRDQLRHLLSRVQDNAARLARPLRTTGSSDAPEARRPR